MNGMDAEERERTARILQLEYGTHLQAQLATWSLITARTSLFLGVLSAASVALALVAQASGFGDTFTTFALVLLPVVLFVGLATYVRVLQVEREAVLHALAMNRIRHFFAEYAPAAAPYLVLSTHDDESGVFRTIGNVHRGPRGSLLGVVLARMPGLFAVIESVVLGATASVASVRAGAAPESVFAIAIVSTVAAFAGLLWMWSRSADQARRLVVPMFPSESRA